MRHSATDFTSEIGLRPVTKFRTSHWGDGPQPAIGNPLRTDTSAPMPSKPPKPPRSKSLSQLTLDQPTPPIATIPSRPLSPMILYSVYVLIALALGKYGAINRSADPKRKLQLTVF
jgi:hypothetical protein